MNFISIILYFGEVANRLVPVSAFVIIICGVACTVLSFGIESVRGPEQELYIKRRRSAFIVGICFFCLFVFIPNKEVLYLIAASELGEEVVTNPEVLDVATELKDIIIQKIKGVAE